MSEYFNPKEDIIKIELTSHGIRKLKEGKLNPTYYSFHDDEVYYGDEHTDLIYTKLQKDDHTRIYKDSSYISSILKNPKNINNAALGSDDKYVNNFCNTSQPLGTSQKKIKLCSSLSVNFHDTKVQISSSYLEQDDTASSNNVTIDLGNIDYILSAHELSTFEGDLPYYQDFQQEENLNEFFGDYTTEMFEDDTFIKLTTPELLFSISELNVDDDFENFEIEIYEYDDDPNEKKYMPMIHPPKYQENIIEDGILTDKDNEKEVTKFKMVNGDKPMSDDLFLIETDQEIPEYLLRSYLNKGKTSNTHDSQESSADIYSNTLSGPFGEDC